MVFCSSRLHRGRHTYYLQTWTLKTLYSHGGAWAHLNAGRDAVDNPDGFAVGVAGQGVGDEVVLHLPRGLGTRLHSINGLTGWTLQTAILRGQGRNSQMGNQFW